MNEDEKIALKKQLSSFDREELENKFIALYANLQKYENDIDFANQKIKRRLQYLHKNYTDNAKIKNALLNELLETKNEALQKYFNSYYMELEKIAQTEHYDEPFEDYPLKLEFE